MWHNLLLFLQPCSPSPLWYTMSSSPPTWRVSQLRRLKRWYENRLPICYSNDGAKTCRLRNINVAGSFVPAEPSGRSVRAILHGAPCRANFDTSRAFRRIYTMKKGKLVPGSTIWQAMDHSALTRTGAAIIHVWNERSTLPGPRRTWRTSPGRAKPTERLLGRTAWLPTQDVLSIQ